MYWDDFIRSFIITFFVAALVASLGWALHWVAMSLPNGWFAALLIAAVFCVVWWRVYEAI